MITNPHSDKPLLEDHEKESSDMFQFEQLGLVDCMGAVQALYDLSAQELGEKRVNQLIQMVGHIFDKHREYLNMSRLCREMYVTCHPDCHALRIQHHIKLSRENPQEF